MLRSIQFAVVGSVCALTLSAASEGEAQITRREANRLAVDVLTLKIGGELRGIILDRSDGAIRMAVRREWLARHQPELLKSLPADSRDAKQYRLLVERIDAWLDDLGTSEQKYSPKPLIRPAHGSNSPEHQRHEELLRVLQAERATYQEYLDDPLKLPPGEGSPEARRSAYRQLADRLDKWMAELQSGQSAGMADAANDGRKEQNRAELMRILSSERETYAKQIDQQEGGGAEEAFVRIDLSRADVGLVFAQSPARRQLALAAYQHDVADVEQLSVQRLQQQLAERDIGWQKGTADPSQLVKSVPPQGERQWAARQAIYEYQFLKRLDFQGTGNFVVQTGDGAPPPNLAALLQGVLQEQRALALGDLLEEPIFTGLDFGGLAGSAKQDGWLKSATRIAEKQGVRGFRVTRMTPDIPRRRTIVEDRFLAKMPEGRWETIWQMQRAESAAGGNQSDVERIKDDPQVKQVLGLIEGLGLGDLGHLDLALQFGAATMNAQQATDDEFYEFRDRYSQRLDGPVLSWK